MNEYNKAKARITKITLLAAPEMILMLQEVLAALQIKEIKPKLLKGKFTSYSLSYQHPSPNGGVGVVWTEDGSMNSFFNVMNACQRVVSQNGLQTLYLIRAMDVGKPNLAGNQIYRQIFTGSQNCHIKPTLSSIHYLAAYHNLVNSARAKELVVDGEILSLKELEELTRETKILQECRLLQDLGIVPHITGPGTDLRKVKDFLLNLVIKHQCLARKVLIENADHQFSQVKESEIDKLIQELCQENKFKIVNPKAKMQEQSICLVP